MKKLLLAFTLLLQAEFYAQSVPNGGFEEWTPTTFDDADGWITSNNESVGYYGVPTVTKVTGQTGFAYRMETKLVGSDTVKGFLLNSNQDFFAGQGGWPYSQQPTSITGYYRYNLPVNDTALLIVIFKAGGSIISSDIFKIKGTGSQSSFASFSFPLTLSSMPDSVLFASTSSNLLTEQGIEPGSFLELDGLAFAGTGITQVIPNGAFENWTPQTVNKLDDWTVWGVEGVARTNDAYAGTYALRLQNNSYMNNGVLDAYPSVISTGDPGNSVLGLPFTNMVDTLCGYYKYTVTGAADSAFVAFSLIDNSDSIIGWENKFLYPISTYTYFEMPISATSAPSLIRVEIGSSLYQSALPGSVLYLDKLLLKSNPTLSISEMITSRKSYSYPNPANEVLNISFDAAFSGNMVLSLYDMTGKVVKKESYTNASVSVQVKTDELLSGAYFYELTNGKETVRSKFIKK